MIHYYIINGYPQSGKDTFVNMVTKICGNSFVRNFTTVSTCKRIARNLGWDGEKDLKTRKFLSDLKDILTEWKDIPFQETVNTVIAYTTYFDTYMPEDDAAVFIMSREPNEIQRFRNHFNAKTIFVSRESAAATPQSNHADKEVENMMYDIVINNNGTLKDLAYKALEFVGEEGLHFPHWRHLVIEDDGIIKYLEK